MATRKSSREPRTPRRGGRGKPALPSKRKPLTKTSKKLTVAERDYALECLAKGWPPSKVREALRQRGAPDVTVSNIASYRKTNAEELLQRKDLWLKSLDGKPLTQKADRLTELLRQYEQLVIAEMRELCSTCMGAGMVVAAPELKEQGEATGKTVVICSECRGRKWRLPDAARALVRSLRIEGAPVLLDTLPELPEDASPKLVELRLAVIKAIQEEVGDHWSLRDRGQTGDEGGGQHLHLHAGDAEALRGMLEMVRALPAERRVALYGGREGGAAVVTARQKTGDGKGDGRG